jgi:hypothetical protein
MSRVFVRDATGLVKTISMFSAFAYNVNSQTVAFAVASYAIILAFIQVAPAFGAYLSYAMAFAWWASAFLLVSIAAIVFPYKAKAIYESSVASRYRIGKVPIITIAGIMATIYVSALVYFWLSVSSLGVNTPGQLSLWGGSMLVAALIYPIIYLVRRKQGINLGLVFRAVPPE